MNNYYEKNGKLNPQIAVSKNNKTILEFLDRLKFEDNSAQVESAYSRIRVGIQDFGGHQSIYKWANVTPEQVRTAYANLCSLDTSPAAALEQSQQELIQIIQMLSNQRIGIDPNIMGYIDGKIREYGGRIEQARKFTSLLEEKKILPYDSYKNPQNPNEYLITGIKIYYTPSLRIPIVFELSQGYGQAFKDEVGRVKYGNEHDTVTVKKMLTITEAKSVLGKVVRFCDAMAQIATQKYFELKTSGLAEETTQPEYTTAQPTTPPPQQYNQYNQPQQQYNQPAPQQQTNNGYTSDGYGGYGGSYQ